MSKSILKKSLLVGLGPSYIENEDLLIAATLYHLFDLHKGLLKKELSGLDKAKEKILHNITVNTFSFLLLKHLITFGLFKADEPIDAFILSEFRKNGLNTEDFRLFYLNIKYGPNYKNLRDAILCKISETADHIPLYGFTSKILYTQCTEMMRIVDKHINIQVYSKLRFIYKHNNMEASDFVGLLYAKAIQVFYRTSPFVSWKHLENTIKRAITNYTINVINFYTSKRRTKLTNEDGSFVTTEVSFNDLYKDSDEERQNLQMKVDSNNINYIDFSYIHNDFHVVDFKISKANVLRKLDEKTRLACSLLLLDKKDTDFIRFCASYGGNINKEIETTEDVLEHFQRKYPKLIMEYYELDKNVMDSAMNVVYSLLKTGQVSKKQILN